MKFSVFADLHHYPGVFMGGTDEDLAFIRKRAEDENCAFIIHAGDFSHGPTLVPDYVEKYNNFRIPTYHCLGNHDSDHTPYDETLRRYRMPDGHYFFDNGGYRFIVCDPNYYYVNGEYIHYDMGNYYKFGAYRDYMPPEQLDWLRETIDTAPGPCILISHESFERDDGVQNREEVLKIINEANKKKPHSVLMCINGHHHRDFIRILDGVCYFDLNSASYDWVEKKHDNYPKELCEEIRLLSNTVVYNDPIHAIITLEGTTITIDGMESSMFMGINREHTENPIYDRAGRPVTPTVQSAKITLG
jgi:predicted phosphodiesterase